MTGYIAFTKKEILEYIRTWKAVILMIVFLIFGISSSLLAKLTPEMLAGMKINGITIIIPEATYVDAYGQFFKNMSQMVIIIMLLVVSGTVSQEISKGTLINVLAKGLARPSVILSKFTVIVLLWSINLMVAASLNYGYTVYLFGKHDAYGYFFSLLCLWLFMVFLFGVLFLSSVVTKGTYGGLLLTAVVFILLLILSAFPKLKDYNPMTLISVNTALITKEISIIDLMPAVWITLGLTFGSILGSLAVFQKKQL
jgi:ABC-2 type transport system permease protein